MIQSSQLVKSPTERTSRDRLLRLPLRTPDAHGAFQYSISGDAEVVAGAGQREYQTLYLSDTEENGDEERADDV